MTLKFRCIDRNSIIIFKLSLCVGPRAKIRISISSKLWRYFIVEADKVFFYIEILTWALLLYFLQKYRMKRALMFYVRNPRVCRICNQLNGDFVMNVMMNYLHL